MHTPRWPALTALASLSALAACTDTLPTAPAIAPPPAPRAAAAPDYVSGRWTVATLFPYEAAGGRASAASAINESGQVTGSYVVDGAGRAFRVTAGQQNVELLGGAGSVGNGINDAGQVAGRENGRPTLWSASGAPRTLESSVSGSSNNWAVNESGVSVGSEFGGQSPTADYARLWAPDGSVTRITGPDSPLAFRESSVARDVNEAGTVLVTASVERVYDRISFIWTASGGLTRLACPNGCSLGRGFEAAGAAINDAGVVVGAVSLRWDEVTRPIFQAAVWRTPDAYQVIGGDRSFANDVNNAGTIVGVGSNGRPAIWIADRANDLLSLSCAEGGPAPLCAAGVTGVAQGINEQGQVVGYVEGLPEGAPRQAVVFTFVPTAGAQAALVSRASGKCADVPAGSREPGTRLAIWPCHGGENQRFALPAPGTSGEIRVYAGAAGALCLDAAGGDGRNGDAIVIWPCHGGANQQWRRTDAGLLVGVNGRCVDVEGGRTDDLTPLLLWDCHGAANQQWDAPPAAAPAAVATR